MSVIVRLTDDGDEQIVRLPEGFAFPGTEVKVHRDGDRVIIEAVDVTAEQLAVLRADIQAGLDSGAAEPWDVAEIRAAARAEFAIAKVA